MPLMREWILFAICLGFGGHIALGFVLHAPDLLPWSRAGFYGILSGITLYMVIKLGLYLWQSIQKSELTESRPADL